MNNIEKLKRAAIIMNAVFESLKDTEAKLAAFESTTAIVWAVKELEKKS